MRILHTSDWHLGRIFYGVHLTDDQAYVLEQFVDLIKETKPDVILVAGDIFDRSVPPIEAVNLLDDVISRILLDCRVPIMMIAGNHDSPDRLGFGYRLVKSKGLNIWGKLMVNMSPVVLYDQYGPVHFYAIPFADPAVVREQLCDGEIRTHDDSMFQLIQRIKERTDHKVRKVLMAHAFVAGGEESESERPLSVGGSTMIDVSYFEVFDYVALGHLHRPQKIREQRIQYSGSLMKYSFSEADHKKHVSIIDMDQYGSITVEHISLKPRRDLRCIKGHLKELLKGPQNGESSEDYMMVTLLDEGAILDAMGRLRKVYPNVLHIERPQFATGSNLIGADRNFRKMNELDLFSSFIYQVTDQEITEQQKKIFEHVLDQYYNRVRED
jgi:exonuclease SbcD